MKTIGWIFGIIAVILMLFGLLDFLIKGAFLGVVHPANFFHAANSCLLLAILCKMSDHNHYHHEEKPE